MLGGGGRWAPHHTRSKTAAPGREPHVPQAAGTAVGPRARSRHNGQHSIGAPLGSPPWWDSTLGCHPVLPALVQSQGLQRTMGHLHLLRQEHLMNAR